MSARSGSRGKRGKKIERARKKHAAIETRARAARVQRKMLEQKEFAAKKKEFDRRYNPGSSADAMTTDEVVEKINNSGGAKVEKVREGVVKALLPGGFVSFDVIEKCADCPRMEPHIHCPECGATDHVAADCDMEG